MAVMIPEKPRQFSPESLEDVMFRALETGLPDDYYVFHSFKIVKINDGSLLESETDFVIFHRRKGILCIEAKAGHPYYHCGTWYYGSGIAMNHDGPFRQAELNKWKLLSYIKDSPRSYLAGKCKLFHAVWFPSVSKEEMRDIRLPPDASKELLMLNSALLDPEKRISEIFDLNVGSGIETQLTENDAKILLDQILCPSFEICPTASFNKRVKEIVFHRLQKEQSAVLNFLIEQRTVAINGAAGTGKTMIAVRKAQMNSANAERTLFLCYNEHLCRYLRENFSDPYIDFYNIDALACRICDSTIADYALLRERMESLFLMGNFAYKHIVIDEGQDFSQNEIAESGLVPTLMDIISDDSINGTFYIFYDKHQLVHFDARTGSERIELPEYIRDADCKITLYKNCRNTENIAITSMRLLPKPRVTLADGSLVGSAPQLYFVAPETPATVYVDSIIERLNGEGIDNIVIVSCVGIESSSLFGFCDESSMLYKNKYLLTTCRKFKGLEADAVILVDVSKDTFSIENENNVNLFYVGASRAKLYLSIVADMDDSDCMSVISQLSGSKANRRPKRAFAGLLNAEYKQNI